MAQTDAQVGVSEMSVTIKGLLLFFVAWIVPMTLLVVMSVREPADAMGVANLGYTDLRGNKAFGGSPYAVFLKRRLIRIGRMVFLEEQNGGLVRKDIVLKNLIPLTTYLPATIAEKELWHHYFQ